MNWTSFDTWIVTVGALCAVACALPGCFLVLRKMSMMGDAISHAVLPGLAIAFFITGTRTSSAMFIGAAIVGILTAVFTEWISRFGNVDRGAAMGIVFTTMFALGLLLIVQAADHVDLDPGCVLYGAIELTPLDTVSFIGKQIPRAVIVISIVAIVNLGIILAFFKELRLSAFDPALADTLGFSTRFLHYLLMAMVAITTVASFEAVMSIIVIAMLIVPPATALLLTRR
ncbi:MAG: metal ABC transporter permease, partial [Methylococcales bacterium]|nr:metal ABC transporter permease [Methylococcales bacterium]